MCRRRRATNGITPTRAGQQQQHIQQNRQHPGALPPNVHPMEEYSSPTNGITPTRAGQQQQHIQQNRQHPGALPPNVQLPCGIINSNRRHRTTHGKDNTEPNTTQPMPPSGISAPRATESMKKATKNYTFVRRPGAPPPPAAQGPPRARVLPPPCTQQTGCRHRFRQRGG